MSETLSGVELVTLSAHDYREELARDVAAGLDSNPKSIPSKYFYDARGGTLFDRITELPEYYLTRAEMSLLEQHAEEIIDFADPTALLELGAGSAAKTSLLLDAGGDHRVSAYASLDVNAAALMEVGQALLSKFPDTAVTGFIGDFVSDLDRVPASDGARLIQFFGSTIGNLTEAQRTPFLRNIAGMMGAADTFLLGVDLVKDIDIIKAAYDDSQGLTSEFTRNILRVVNRELDADFAIDAFEHLPVWNAEKLRMEAWLRAIRPMVVKLNALEFTLELDRGEKIHTEVSCKFSRHMVEQEFFDAGLQVSHWYTDPGRSFAIALGNKN